VIPSITREIQFLAVKNGNQFVRIKAKAMDTAILIETRQFRIAPKIISMVSMSFNSLYKDADFLVIIYRENPNSAESPN
jgi:hypothetical protein